MLKKLRRLFLYKAVRQDSIKRKKEAQLSLTSSITQEATIDTKISGQNRVDDVKECPRCKDKDFTNFELTEALSRQSALVTAEKLSAV